MLSLSYIRKDPLTLCYIRESFFVDHPDYKKMLDPGNTNKQSKRTHLCVEVTIDNNHYYIPLRKNLGDAVRKFGRISGIIIQDMVFLKPQRNYIQ